jgi:hypothetical protein
MLGSHIYHKNSFPAWQISGNDTHFQIIQMMKVTVVFKRLLASGNDQHGRHLFKWGEIFLASILLKEMRYLVYIRYL